MPPVTSLTSKMVWLFAARAVMTLVDAEPAPARVMAIHLLHTRAGGHVFHAGPLFLLHDHGPLTHASVKDFDFIEPVIERFETVSFLRVVDAHLVGRPPPSVTRAVESCVQRLGPKLLCAAVVVRGTGLAPLWMRTAMTGSLLRERGAVRRKAFGNMREGLTWLQLFEGQSDEVKMLGVAEIEAALTLPTTGRN